MDTISSALNFPFLRRDQSTYMPHHCLDPMFLGNFYFMPVPISSGQCLLGGESLTGVRGKDGGVSDELMLHNKLPPNLVAQYQQQSVLSPLTVSMRRALLRVSGSGPSCSSLQTLAGAKGQGGL